MTVSPNPFQRHFASSMSGFRFSLFVLEILFCWKKIMSTGFQLAGELLIDPSRSNADEIEPHYVLDLKLSKDLSHLLATASNNSVYIYDTNQFKPISTINNAHSNTITSIVPSKVDSNLFFTSSTDGTVKGWDIRQSTQNSNHSFKLHLKEEVNAMNVSLEGSLLASAINNEIRFFDIRKSANQNAKCSLGGYCDTHSDMVTHLEFAPNHNNLLLSGGEDGLICIYDTSAAEADDAVVSILNTECPIQRVGFFGPDLEGIYCLSTVETASFWHYPSAQRLAKFDNIRDTLDANYLVDCLYDAQQQQLYVQAGNFEGKFSINAVDPSKVNVSTYSYSNHTAMLRCSVAVPNFISSAGTNGFFTGGEDGKISYWKSGLPTLPTEVVSSLDYNSQNIAAVSENTANKIQKATIPKSLKASTKAHNNRYKPY